MSKKTEIVGYAWIPDTKKFNRGITLEENVIRYYKSRAKAERACAFIKVFFGGSVRRVKIIIGAK